MCSYVIATAVIYFNLQQLSEQSLVSSELPSQDLKIAWIFREASRLNISMEPNH